MTKVVALLPVAVNPGNVSVSFDVLSYAGTLAVTLVCDPGLVPESAWLAQRVTAGLTASGGPFLRHSRDADSGATSPYWSMLPR